MTHSLTLDSEQERLLAAKAAELDVSLEEYIQQVVTAEARRLWYVERSKPKNRSNRPVGRPPEPASSRRFKELAGQLRDIYAKLRGFYGAEFQAAFGSQVSDLEVAIETKDVDKLEALMRGQAWVRRA